MTGKVDSENDMLEMHHIEITKFHSSTAVFIVVMKMKIGRKLLLSELQRNTRRQDQETDKDDIIEHEGGEGSDSCSHLLTGQGSHHCFPH
jgi:hypothetical protein